MFEYGFGLDESGYPGRIGVTQPRRVAAVSVAKRVAYELGGVVVAEDGDVVAEKAGRCIVAHQVRYDSTVSDATIIKFMTDGILMKEVQSDFLLSSYSAIALDEVHERNVNTDMLIGLLSRAVRMRRKLADEGAHYPNDEKKKVTCLKLIIMSATLRVEDFTGNELLFSERPQVVHVRARTFPVVSHFVRYTNVTDYVQEAMDKVVDIHRSLPVGTVLVFLTGRAEIMRAVRSVGDKFSAEALAEAAKKLEAYREANGQGQSDNMVEQNGEPNIDDEKMYALEGDVGENEEYDASNVEIVDELGNIMGPGAWDGEPQADDEAEQAESASRREKKRSLFGLLDRNQDTAEDTSDWLVDDSGGWDDDDDSPVEASGGRSDAAATSWNSLVLRATSTSNKTADTGDGSMGDQDGGLERRAPALSRDQVAQRAGFDTELMSKRDGGLVTPILALPLYSALSPQEQMRVFEPPPTGVRVVVFATDVAETSITIPDVKYVVDTGRSKQRLVDQCTGASRYSVEWISKAAAQQRAGRAGRTGPGHCYRLVSPAVYDRCFKDFSDPEIMSVPMTSILLQMKYMALPYVSRFPFPTRPDVVSMRRAMRELLRIGALRVSVDDEDFARQLARLRYTSAKKRLASGSVGGGGRCAKSGAHSDVSTSSELIDYDRDSTEEATALQKVLGHKTKKGAKGAATFAGRGSVVDAVAFYGEMNDAHAMAKLRLEDMMPAARIDVAGITPLGETLAMYPLAPRFALLLVRAQELQVMMASVLMVAAMSVADPFVQEPPNWLVSKCERQLRAIQQVKRGHDESAGQLEGSGVDVASGADAVLDGAYASLAELEHAHEQEMHNIKEMRRDRSDVAQARWEGALHLHSKRAAQKEVDAKHGMFLHEDSDALSLLRVAGAYMTARDRRAFCKKYFVSHKSLLECEQLAMQVLKIWYGLRRDAGDDKVALVHSPSGEGISQAKTRPTSLMCTADDVEVAGDEATDMTASHVETWGSDVGSGQNKRGQNKRGPRMPMKYPVPKLTPKVQSLMRLVLCAVLCDRVGRLVTPAEVEESAFEAIGILNPVKHQLGYRCYQIMYDGGDAHGDTTQELCLIHPGSHVAGRQLPKFVVFQELWYGAGNGQASSAQAASKGQHGTRAYMRGVTAVKEEWLARVGEKYCKFSNPEHVTYSMTRDSVSYTVACRYGMHRWSIGAVNKVHAADDPGENDTSGVNDDADIRLLDYCAALIFLSILMGRDDGLDVQSRGARGVRGSERPLAKCFKLIAGIFSASVLGGGKGYERALSLQLAVTRQQLEAGKASWSSSISSDVRAGIVSSSLALTAHNMGDSHIIRAACVAMAAGHVWTWHSLTDAVEKYVARIENHSTAQQSSDAHLDGACPRTRAVGALLSLLPPDAHTAVIDAVLP